MNPPCPHLRTQSPTFVTDLQDGSGVRPWIVIQTPQSDGPQLYPARTIPWTPMLGSVNARSTWTWPCTSRVPVIDLPLLLPHSRSESTTTANLNRIHTMMIAHSRACSYRNNANWSLRVGKVPVRCTTTIPTGARLCQIACGLTWTWHTSSPEATNLTFSARFTFTMPGIKLMALCPCTNPPLC